VTSAAADFHRSRIAGGRVYLARAGSLLAAMFERRAKSELHSQKMLLDSAITNMSQGLSGIIRCAA
jgi:hypothetical protein